jgi:hypothetical protein
MATIVFSAIGTLVGGPIGGAIGALAGRQVDAMLFRPGTRQGPRLTELNLSASSYGLPLPRQFGRVRTGGQVIWASDLTEQQSRQGGGKSRPSTVSYSYAASFAVALSSRAIMDIGRIWADGKLLRGAAGDLKVGGSLRIYSGNGDQQPDPLLAAAEGAACPAHRGLAYVVFEDLQLAEYGNRIPALSFEVIADPGVLDLQAMLGPVVPDCDAAVPLNGVEGLTADGSPAELLSLLDPIFPLDCDACDARLTIQPQRNQSQPLTLPEPAVANSTDEFGGKTGFACSHSLSTDEPISVLRYYDPDRDYQPGAQRAPGRTGTGEPRAVELPATITAGAARALVHAAASQAGWRRHTLAWRVTALDPAVRPGAVVTLPEEPGRWRVKTWEWRAEGVELALERIAPDWPALTGGIDPGRSGTDPDLVQGPTVLAAFELPWDGNPATALPQLFVAAASATGAWNGAALFVDQGDNTLQPIGSTGRGVAIIGTSNDALAAGSPLLFDRTAAVTVTLTNPGASLADATLRQMVQGANKALLGNELIQFAQALPLGGGQWQLSGLLRGRGGTEAAVAKHGPGEPFVLLDGPLALLDPVLVGPAEHATIAAIGTGDSAPVLTPIGLADIGWRPLAPVHGRAVSLPDGGLKLIWARRARGGWRWDDGVDLPLNEQRENYAVEFGSPELAVARWDAAAPAISVSAAEWTALSAAQPAGIFSVRQVGDRAVSLPLIIKPA